MDKTKIIEENSKLIHTIAKKFYGIEKEDLYQAGVVGLLKACSNFKHGTCKFSTYAYDYIYGEMYNLVSNRPIKVNRNMLKLFQLIEKTRSNLSQRLGKIPSNEEIAKFLELPIASINEAILSGMQLMSLDSEREMPYYESIKADEKLNVDDQILLAQSMELLTDDEQAIIKSRYYEDLTQSEVAKKLCMTQVMVSRYEKKGLTKMQAFLQK